MNEYLRIGKLAASFGLKGELVLQHHLGKKTSLKGLETIFIEEGSDNFMPYFISNATARNDREVFIKIEGIDSKEAARKLTPKEAWVKEADFKKFASTDSPVRLLGFMLVSNGELLGEINEVIEQPHQLLCSINISGKEALIPIHEDSLEKIDRRQKKVFVNLPDGLLDIYK